MRKNESGPWKQFFLVAVLALFHGLFIVFVRAFVTMSIGIECIFFPKNVIFRVIFYIKSRKDMSYPHIVFFFCCYCICTDQFCFFILCLL